MTATPVAVEENANSSTIALETVVKALRKLTPEQLSEVIQYILFLQYKPMLLDDVIEDEALWQAIEVNQRYDEQHPDEPLLSFESGEEFLRATAEW